MASKTLAGPPVVVTLPNGLKKFTRRLAHSLQKISVNNEGKEVVAADDIFIHVWEAVRPAELLRLISCVDLCVGLGLPVTIYVGGEETMKTMERELAMLWSPEWPKVVLIDEETQ